MRPDEQLNTRILDNGALLPHGVFPTSWYQVAWSHEIGAAAVMPISYFGRDMVCFRTASGKVSVFDAYCRHLGANLAIGGQVVEENLRCPFHGWEYDTSGVNVKIPYGSLPCNPRARLRTYPVREQNGIVYIWYSPDGGSPSWEPPDVAEFDDPAFYDLVPHGVMKQWKEVPFGPQHVLENSADYAHLKYVHKNAEVATVEKMEADGVRFAFTFGTTYLTPDDGAVPGAIPGEWWGMGILLFNILGVHEAAEIVTITPIDHGKSDLRISVTARRDDGEAEARGMAQRIMLHQVKEIDRDIPIWANMRYLVQPSLAPEEARGFKLLRQWSDQFYVVGDQVGAAGEESSPVGTPAM